MSDEENNGTGVNRREFSRTVVGTVGGALGIPGSGALRAGAAALTGRDWDFDPDDGAYQCPIRKIARLTREPLNGRLLDDFSLIVDMSFKKLGLAWQNPAEAWHRLIHEHPDEFLDCWRQAVGAGLKETIDTLPGWVTKARQYFAEIGVDTNKLESLLGQLQKGHGKTAAAEGIRRMFGNDADLADVVIREWQLLRIAPLDPSCFYREHPGAIPLCRADPLRLTEVSVREMAMKAADGGVSEMKTLLRTVSKLDPKTVQALDRLAPQMRQIAREEMAPGYNPFAYRANDRDYLLASQLHDPAMGKNATREILRRAREDRINQGME